jgi:GGDEF domain-containing protein/HAMP domain-containing protein
VETGLEPRGEAQEQALTRRAVAIIDPITAFVARLAATEVEHARASQADAEATYRATRSRVVGTAAAAALVWLVISLLLIRNLVPRVRSYSRFAAGVADGHPGEQLTVRGADELAELGHTLNEMVRRRHEQRAYEQTQAEFADTMQLSETETEAHHLLKHHLERSIAGSRVTVLNRNNSADRLEAATPVETEGPLATTLPGAKPRSCLAIRFGRGYRGGEDHVPLLACGEVIGSILVNHPDPPGGQDPLRIRESVTQAAPVLANLRNLAIAEVRAATDALTGLPNTRAVQDTIKRMVAQASRTVSPLSAALLDWTTSSGSTTPTGTAAVMRSLPPWPWSCARRSARATSWAATAARSSSCCCPTPDATRPPSSPRRSARPWPAWASRRSTSRSRRAGGGRRPRRRGRRRHARPRRRPGPLRRQRERTQPGRAVHLPGQARVPATRVRRPGRVAGRGGGRSGCRRRGPPMRR